VNGQDVARSPIGTMPGRAASEVPSPGSPEVLVPRAAAYAPPGPILDAPGFDLRPDPLQADTPGKFASALRRYWIWSGKTPYRELVRRSGGELAISTISVMLTKETLPSQSRMIAFMSACGATEEDRQRFVTAWRLLSLAYHADGLGTQQIPASRHAAERLPDRQDRLCSPARDPRRCGSPR
jgi:hypothetical protein